LDGGFRLSFGDEEEKVACLSVSLWYDEVISMKTDSESRNNDSG
jgi:hypothetical protein